LSELTEFLKRGGDAPTESGGALADTTALIRRDAQALDTAGREIAMASAAMVRRLSEVVHQMETAVARWPAAAESTTEMRREAEALRATAADAAVQVAEALMHAARSSHQLLGGLPALTEGLASVASDLIRGAQLHQGSRPATSQQAA
jgi:ABC-type transporter Mla subunit MlaD